LARKRLAASTGPVERGITSSSSRRVQRNRSSFFFPRKAGCFRARAQGRRKQKASVLLRLRARVFWLYKSEINVTISCLCQGVFVSSVGEGNVEKWVTHRLLIDSCTRYLEILFPKLTSLFFSRKNI
jgi:hypothetical protein